MHFDFPQRVLRVLCAYFVHERKVTFENNVSEPTVTATAIFPVSKLSVLFLRSVVQDAMKSVFFVSLN